MTDKIEKILDQEERRIEEEDRTHPVGGYVTSPRGMWDIHLETLRRRSVDELVRSAEQGEYRDIGVLKVIHDAYVTISRGYLTGGQRK